VELEPITDTEDEKSSSSDNETSSDGNSEEADAFEEELVEKMLEIQKAIEH
jgi:hypothetical protein